MNRKIFLLIFLQLPLLLAGQTLPRWTDNSYRVSAYPSDRYYTGFSMDIMNTGGNLEAVIKRLTLTAKSELSEKIRVKITSQTDMNTQSIMQSGMDEQFNEIYTSARRSEAQAEITGIKTESYYNRSNGEVYVFAYAARADLQNYYRQQITLHLGKIEGALQTSGELADKGYKMKARKQCEDVLGTFAAVAYAQDLLTAVDPNADESSMQLVRSERLRNTLIQTLTDLENSIFIYVECSETVNGQTVVHIGDRLPGLLTEQGCGCSITDLQEEADYVIKINARLARCNDAPDNIVFCYANATVSVYNARTQKTQMPKLADAKGGWTDRNRDRATEEAFDELAGSIAEKVIPMINN